MEKSNYVIIYRKLTIQVLRSGKKITYNELFFSYLKILGMPVQIFIMSFYKECNRFFDTISFYMTKKYLVFSIIALASAIILPALF